MKCLMLIIFAPIMALSQSLEFELQPEAFPAEIGGWQLYCPWAGAMKNTTPEFCDLDSDGDYDYFSGSYNHFWFFSNNGTSANPQFDLTSSFFDSITCLGGAGSLYEPNIVFADLDNDGDQDLVGSLQFLGVAWNFGNAAQWSFAAMDSILDINGQSIGTVRFELADIDADGDLDLFTEDWSPSALRFWENVGTPQSYAYNLVTTNWQNLQVSPGGKLSPCFADLDTDGDLDLLVGTGAGTVYYYRNDGTPQNAQMTYVTNNYFNIDVGDDASPELADIDGDGDLDLFVGRSSPEGQFATQGDMFFYENIGTPQAATFEFVTSNYLSFDSGIYSIPRLTDIDGDGDPDLFCRMGYSLILYRNQGAFGNPNFVYETENFGGISVNTMMPWFCDVDADGDYDLFCGSGAIPGPPGLYLFLNQGTPQNPQFSLYSSNLLPGVFSQSSVVITPSAADVDSDGDYDLFVSDNDALFYYFENVGTPTRFQYQFVTSNWQNIADTTIGGHRFSCFYDMDQDGDLDLFISSEAIGLYPWDKNLMFYRNLGTPQNAQMVLENEDLFPELMIWQAAPFLIDIDQDGDGDMFVGDSWGGIRYFKNVTGDTNSVSHPKVAAPYRGPVLSIGPNPANPLTVISCKLPAASNISLEIFDICGRKLVGLASGLHLPGEYRYVWDATKNASGIYIIRLSTPQQSFSEKIVMMK